jgi:outer membrane biosynthesis protein TonB
VVKYVEVPAKAQQSEADSKSEKEAASESEEETDDGDAKTPSKGGKGTKSGKVVAASQTKQEGLKGLSGLSNLKGPQNGPSGNQTTNSSSGRPLDSAAVQGTVRRYTGSVKRSCWQPALDTRDANAPTSARVSVAITVGATGSVQNVSTSGDPKGYRGLATCIARRVRGWQFPASSGTTTVNVPFVFAAQ